MSLCECMSVYVCILYMEESHIAVFQRERVLIYWLCQRIPSDQVQFSSPALISSTHQGFSSIFSPPHSLTLILPPAFPLTATHQLTQTTQQNPITSGNLNQTYFLCVLRFKTPLNRMASVLPLHPRYFAPIYLRAHVCVCVSLFLNASMTMKREQRDWSPAMTGPHSLSFRKILLQNSSTILSRAISFCIFTVCVGDDSGAHIHEDRMDQTACQVENPSPLLSLLILFELLAGEVS